MLLCLFLGTLALFTLTLDAYPPSPSSVITGVIRDPYGDPWTQPGATVILYVGDVEVARATITSSIGGTENYRLFLPMESGVREESYRPNALQPFDDVSLIVNSGGIEYLPIEANGSLTVSEPTTVRRLDFTLGEDSDGDGLPDKWEEWQLSDIGIFEGMDEFSYDLIDPDADSDKDGVLNRIEYFAGTFIFDEGDTFALEIIGQDPTTGLLEAEFLTVSDRVYEIEELGEDLTWSPISFVLDNPTASAQSRLQADEIAYRTVYISGSPDSSRLYRLVLK